LLLIRYCLNVIVGCDGSFPIKFVGLDELYIDLRR
jgi:hypothetical protein